jgi:hypothetical protein
MAYTLASEESLNADHRFEGIIVIFFDLMGICLDWYGFLLNTCQKMIALRWHWTGDSGFQIHTRYKKDWSRRKSMSHIDGCPIVSSTKIG